MATVTTVTPVASQPRQRSAPAPTYAELQAQLAKLERENAQLAANQKQQGTLSWKTSSNGGLILYGMQRFPVTLKAEQWERMIELAIGSATDKGSIAWAIAEHRAGRLPVKQVEAREQ